MGPEQVEQRMGQFRQLVVELLPQPTCEKGEAFQQALDIRILTSLAQKGCQRRIAFGEARTQLTQLGQLALVVVIEGHGPIPG